MKSTLRGVESGRYLARVIPMLILTALYLAVALRKALSAGDELVATTATDGPDHLLLALHLVSGAVFYGVIGALMLTRKEPIRREKRLRSWLLAIAPTIVLSVIGFYEPRDFPTAVMLVATAFVVAGTIFTVYALRHLGRHFGVIPDVRGLVTTGPYTWMRHPLYGAEALTMIGLVIAVASPVTLLIFVFGMMLQIWRAKVEEHALTAVFPEYRDYASRTPMLIPLTKFSLPAIGDAKTTD